MVNRINPTAPTTANIIAITDRIFCQVDVFGASRCLCRNQRSAMNTMSKVTTVTAPMAMKSGCSEEDPMSDM